MSFNHQEPKTSIVPDEEEVIAEEYVEDNDHVFKSKKEVKSRYSRGSLFKSRLLFFLSFSVISFLSIIKFISLNVCCFRAIFRGFKDHALNLQVAQVTKDLVSLVKFASIQAIGILNPNWGKKLLNIFFLTNDNYAFS